MSMANSPNLQAKHANETKSKKGSRRWLRTSSGRATLNLWAFTSPFWLGFILINLLPLVVGFVISLTNYDGMNWPTGNLNYLGLQNYARVLQDDMAIFGAQRTLIWTLYRVPIHLVVAFALAVLLNQIVNGRGFFRAAFYLPTIIPLVGAVWVWRMFLGQNFGLLNGLISLIRPGTAIPFLSDYAMQSLVVISVWSGLGTGVVIFLAALQGIPTELQEAARIDGANNWQILFHVTIPLMTPVIWFVMILSVIGGLQQFAFPMVLASTAGDAGYGSITASPARDVYLYMIHVVRQIFAYQRYGYGSALMWLLFVIIVSATIFGNWSTKFWVHYESDV